MSAAVSSIRAWLETHAEGVLVVTGGSDYHGAHKPGLRLGHGRGGLKVPDDLLDRLETRQRLGTYH